MEKEEIGPYLSHLPTCQINQNWQEAFDALADTPTQFRDHGWNEAYEDARKKSTTCSCDRDIKSKQNS